MALKNRIIKRLVNIPHVLHFGQNFLGANQYKLRLYASVFAKKTGTLLDFGCSYGNTTQAFLNFDYYGVDIDSDAIAAAKQRFKNYPHVHFACLDIVSHDYRKDFFDHVLFASTSHHLADGEFRKILEKLMACLKRGGELHFFDIMQKPDDHWTTRLLTRLDQGKYIRTKEQTMQFFQGYPTADTRIFPSPKRLITLWDFLYVKIIRP